MASKRRNMFQKNKTQETTGNEKPAWCISRPKGDASDSGSSKAQLTPKGHGLENRFKIQMSKYTENIREWSTLKDKMATNIKFLHSIKEQILATTGRDPGEIPDLGIARTCLSCSPELHSHTFSPPPSPRQTPNQEIKAAVAEPVSSAAPNIQRLKSKIETLEEENLDLIEKLNSVTRHYESQTAYLNKIKEEMPVIEDQCGKLATNVQKLDSSQTNLDDRITTLSRDVESLTEWSNMTSILRTKYERVLSENQALKKSLEEDRNIFMEECQRFEEDRKLLEEKLQNEIDARKSLEDAAENMTSQIVEMQNSCRQHIAEFEMLKQNQRYSEAKSINEKETDQKIISRLSSELQNFKRELRDKEDLVNDLNRKVAHLTEEITQYEYKRTAEHNLMSEQMHTEIVKREEEIKSLKAQLVDMVNRTIGDRVPGGFSIAAFLRKLSDASNARTHFLLQCMNIHRHWMQVTEENEKLEESLVEKCREITSLKIANSNQLSAMDSQNAFIKALREDDMNRQSEIQKIIEMMQDQEMKQRGDQHEEPTCDKGNVEDCEIVENVEENVGIGVETPSDLSTSLSTSMADNGYNKCVDDCPPPKGYNQMIAQMKEKNWELLRMEKKLQQLERAHATCASRRISGQSKLACLEFALA
ncbi:hypothetical protein AAG570_013866 [Ranatra chinensis]|uniref:Uncharacterized protein n=1 Tax=Ranatra chinensis TaxID=642074 RepID=A0ABD0YS45_9HEMI